MSSLSEIPLKIHTLALLEEQLPCLLVGLLALPLHRWRDIEHQDVVGAVREYPADVFVANGARLALNQNYHFWPRKIEMYLKRYHDITCSVSGIWRILKRLDMNRLPASQRYKRHVDRWKRYEKLQPGHQVQIDVKFIAPLKGSRKRYYQFTAIDDCTRLRVLRLYDRLNQKTAIQFADYVLERLPFPGRGDPDR